MERKYFVFNSIVTLIICFMLFLSCKEQKTASTENSNISNNADVSVKEDEIIPTLELDSEQFLEHTNFIIRRDDSRVIVGRGDTLLYTYQLPNNKFVSDLHYDRIDNLVSFKECKFLNSNRDHYSYELKAWDFFKNEIYVVSKGDAYTDGEGINVLDLIKYDPRTKCGVLMLHGYEWMNPIILTAGVEHSLGDLGYDIVDLLAILPNDEFILSLFSLGDSEENKYVKYSLAGGIIDTLSVEQLEEYKDLMIKQLGTKHRFTDLSSASRTNWNPTGEFCFYIGNDGQYYFYYDNNKIKYKVLTVFDEVEVIWK